jgi:hypothetical protein
VATTAVNEFHAGLDSASMRLPGEGRQPVMHWTPAFAGVTNAKNEHFVIPAVFPVMN